MQHRGLIAGTPSNRVPAVLIVEDDVLIRSAAAQHLRDSGFTVLEAVSVDEALTILGQGTPVDLVFSDVNLPGGLSGTVLAQVILTDCPQVKVLLTSGVRPPAEVEGIPLIKKPYLLFELERQIRSLLANHNTIDHQ